MSDPTSSDWSVDQVGVFNRMRWGCTWHFGHTAEEQQRHLCHHPDEPPGGDDNCQPYSCPLIKSPQHE